MKALICKPTIILFVVFSFYNNLKKNVLGQATAFGVSTFKVGSFNLWVFFGIFGTWLDQLVQHAADIPDK